MKTFTHNFIRCGIVGWCLEILFTSLHSLQRRDWRLRGQTSIWMFPIYGMAALLAPVSKLLKTRPALLRGTVYASCIFFAEYLSGCLLQKKGCCPWDYGRSKWHIKHIIRLDYAPIWFLTGLLFERILSKPR